MTRSYVVKPGEHLPAIAERHGFIRSKVLWDDPANAFLKQQRRVPEILAPGDELFIPERKSKTVAAPAGQKLRFVVARDALELRLRIRDLARRPVANSACTITVEGADQRTVATDGNGIVAQPIRGRDTSATLVVGALRYEVLIGGLDPIEEPSGVQARLINLGYLEGPVRGPEDEVLDDDARELCAAIEEFQCDHGLSLTGRIDAATQARLLDVHGC
jgi:hypothetical protein